MNKQVVLKKNNRVQRADTVLTLEIVNALTEMILSGRKVFSPKGYIQYISVDKEGKEKTVTIKTGTLNAWIRRGNVVPETGETLRDVLDRAREQYRIKKEDKRRGELLGDADREIKRTLNIRTAVPIYNKLGKPVTREDGSPVTYEHPKLLKVKVDVAKFVMERLNPERWGNVQKTENKSLHVFCLADLRKAKKEMDSKEDPTQ
jgi:hypothetical protein